MHFHRCCAASLSARLARLPSTPAIVLASFAGALGSSAPARAVVIQEIHYHPAGEAQGLEFVEIANDVSTPQDISGYFFSEGIDFTFPEGTILGPIGTPTSYAVVAADPAALRSAYGLESAFGPFAGRLDNSGERITLANQAGIEIQSVRYQHDGKWPVAPDGTGHSLVLKNPYLDPGEPESWTQSPELGGSPGRPNLPSDEPQYRVEVHIAKGASWRYAKGTQDFSTPSEAWRNLAFDDSAWPEGPSGFGFADNDDATPIDDMLNGYTSLAVRTRFTVGPSDLDDDADFFLAIDYDDGFCAYIDGKEVARANCGPPDIDPAWSNVASLRHEAGKEETFKLSREALTPGEHVLAIIGLNFRITDNDFSLTPRLIRQIPIDTGKTALPSIVFNELGRGAQAGEGWIELYNLSSQEADLSSFILTDDPGRADPLRLPEGTKVAPRAFFLVGAGQHPLDLSAPELELFLLAPDGRAAASTTFRRQPPATIADPPGWSECRYPDGAEGSWITRTPTPGAANQVERVTSIVLNEIFYHPPEERGGEFIELYNRGSERVDLSGFSFTRGIDFRFAEGTAIGPGEYRVLADDPEILRQDYGVEALGPYEGRLADDGESIRLVDALENVAAEVRYHDGGTWSPWADGGGSSLELIDPAQDPSFGASWDSSDETAKAPWEQLTFHVADYVPTASSELHLYLVERGVCRIDDVSITRAGGANMIANPSFEVDTRPWVIQGTHVDSARLEGDAHSGQACLEIRATGKGDTLVNRIETDTQPAMTRGQYDVSLWARWQRGASVIVAHGEFTPGAFGGRPSPAVNLSGNSLSAGLRMTVPRNNGTPGAENSARRLLREATGSDNLGPVIDSVVHSPPSPPANQPVHITARVADSDGIGSVEVHYALNSAASAFTVAPLADDGAHGDGEAGDGLYGGELPGFAARAKVVFFVEAKDSSGAVGRFPASAPERTCLFMAQGPLADKRPDTFRVVLDSARTVELQQRPLHSNDLVDAALVFRDSEVYYNVGVRYRGSPWGRPARANYRVRLQDDQVFHRGRKAVNFSSRGGAANEGSAYWLCGRNGVPGSPSPTPDYFYVKFGFNGAGASNYGLIQPVDRDYLSKWFPGGSDGAALKCEGRRQFQDGGDLAGWDGCSYTYRNELPENYRAYFIPQIRRSVDDWQPFMDLCQTMDRRKTKDADFDANIAKVLDVESFLRVLSVRILTADWDAFGVGNGHNGVLVHSSADKLWKLLPFDVDNTFSSAAPSLFPTADPEVARFLARPWARRLYFQILEQYLAGYWSQERARPYLNAVQASTGVNTQAIQNHLNSSGRVVQNATKAASSAAFQVITGGGAEIVVDGPTVELEGDAPLKVDSILVSVNGGQPRPFEMLWTTPSRWKAAISLERAVTDLQFLGLDRDGMLVGQVDVRVRSTALVGAFLRGDANNDGRFNVTDAIGILSRLFRGGQIACEDAADIDDNGELNLTDALDALLYLFQRGSAPAAPFPAAGMDPTEDALGCGS